MDTKTTLDYALAAAEMGIYVFPCKPVDKKPLFKAWPERASIDTATIQDWFAHIYKGAMIGAVTGSKSGIYVLDIDVKDGISAQDKLKQIENSYGELPKTLVVATPSGGRHLYFRLPVNCSIRSGVNKYGIHGVDIRAEGGYAIFPGSVRADGKQYRIIN